MKIMLVEPPVSPFDVPTGDFGLPPPHHLERLAGALIDYHDVMIFDMRIETGLEKALDDFRPDMVGSSCVAANYHLALDVCLRAKKFNPEIITVIGGHHPSLAPKMCDDRNIDYVVIGEGEITLKELVKSCEENKDNHQVSGIAFRNEAGEFTINSPRKLMNLDDLPPAARILTRRYREMHLYFRSNWRPTDSIISSRGCPYRCNFCGLWKINHGQYRCRKPEAVVNEIETISDPYVVFIDDNTIDNVPNAYKLAGLLKERGIKKKYEMYGRSDTVVRHPDLIIKLRDVGMKLLLLGLESCEQKLLDSMNKNSSIQNNLEAITICHANDVEIVAYLVVSQDFDKEDFRRLSDFVSRNKLTHPVFTILSPFPGTDFYDAVKDKLITRSLKLIDFYHTVLPTKLPLDEFYSEYYNLYKKAYPVKNFITSAFQNRSVLSPKNIIKSLKLSNKMSKLRQHHFMVNE